MFIYLLQIVETYHVEQRKYHRILIYPSKNVYYNRIICYIQNEERRDFDRMVHIRLVARFRNVIRVACLALERIAKKS